MERILEGLAEAMMPFWTANAGSVQWGQRDSGSKRLLGVYGVRVVRLILKEIYL